MSEIIGAARQAGAAPSADALIRDGSIETFEADVLNASMTVPVIVDFWAEWCGPCKQLAPALERAVTAAKGKVRLVKIDIDKNQMLANQLRIQSIPTVYAFFQGRPVDGFQGAVPESQVKEFVARLSALGGETGAPDIGAMLDGADVAFNAGDVAGAADIYGRVAEAEEGNARALAGLARCEVALGDVDRAQTILDMVPEAGRKDPAVTSVAAALALAKTEKPAGDLGALKAKAERDPKDLAAQFDLAGAYISSGDMEAGLDALLAIIERDRAWNEEAAKKKLLTVFEALGPAHPLTARGRRRLSSILFS